MVPPPASRRRPRPITWLWAWGPVVFYCLLIFGLSSISDIPAPPAGMSDKSAHALLYSGLGFLVARAFSVGRDGGLTLGLACLTIVLCLGYGLSDETHQRFVPRRQFDLNDLAADGAGAAAGTVALGLWGIIRPVSAGSRRPGPRGGGL